MCPSTKSEENTLPKIREMPIFSKSIFGDHVSPIPIGINSCCVFSMLLVFFISDTIWFLLYFDGRTGSRGRSDMP